MTGYRSEVRPRLKHWVRTIMLGHAAGALLPQLLVNGGVLSLLVLQLGGGNFEIGLIFTVDFLGEMVRVLVASRADDSDRRQMVLWWDVLSLGAAALLLTSWLAAIAVGEKHAVWLVCFAFFLYRVSFNISRAAWVPLLADLVPSPLHGRFLGGMRRNAQLATFFAGIAVGLLLGESPPLSRHYLVLSLLIALAVLRPVMVSRLPSPVTCGEGETAPANLGRSVRDALADRRFRRFMLGWSLLIALVMLGRPFAVPFLKSALGYPSSLTIYASSAQILGVAAGLATWGRRSDRLGTKLSMAHAALLSGIAMGALAAVPTFSDAGAWGAGIGAFALAGIGFGVGGQNLIRTVHVLRVAPATNRSVYLGLFFVVNGAVAALASGTTGLLLDTVPTQIFFSSRGFGNGTLYLRAHFALIGVALSANGLIRLHLVRTAK